MKYKFIISLLLAVSFIAGSTTADEGDQYMPDEDQRRRILNGEVISIPVHTDDEGGTVWGAIRIDAPAEAVFKSIVYCNGETSPHKSMRNCKTLEKTPEYEIAEHQIKFHWLVPRQTYLFRGDYTGFTKIRFRVLEGDLKKLDGGWDMFPIEGEDTLLVRYYATIQPKLPIPRWLIRKSRQKQIPEMLKVMRDMSENPEIMAALDAAEEKRLAKEAKRR